MAGVRVPVGPRRVDGDQQQVTHLGAPTAGDGACREGSDQSRQGQDPRPPPIPRSEQHRQQHAHLCQEVVTRRDPASGLHRQGVEGPDQSRQERTLSWLVQQAWRMAGPTIQSFPGVDELGDRHVA